MNPVSRNCWTIVEDTLAHQGVAKHGKDWHKIHVDFLPGRTVRQIKKHYETALDPSIDKSEWSDLELSILLSEYKKFPNQWSKIGKSLSNRAPAHIRYKYKTLQSKEHKVESKQTTTKHVWTLEEDKLLLEKVDLIGKKWTLIRKQSFSYLTRVQLITRYKNLTSDTNAVNKQESKERIDREEPAPKRRRLISKPQPQIPLNVKVQGLISDFLHDLEKLTNSSERNND